MVYKVGQKGGDGDNTMHGIRRVEEDNSGVGLKIILLGGYGYNTNWGIDG